MPTQYKLSVDLAPFAHALTVAGNEIALRVSMTVAATAQTIYERWVDSVMKAPGIWMGEKDAYAQSIKVRSISGFEAEVWSDYKHAAEIETGRPARDLKKMLDTSMKVRISAKGARYLYIPMRHNTPGNDALANPMPQSVYDAAKNLSPSSIVGQSARLSGTGAYDVKTKQAYLVPKHEYQWGGRLPAGMAPKLKPEHKTDIYAGMTKFKNAAGGSSYLTFRTMSENSPGWIIPAKPGLFIVRNILDEVQPLFIRGIEESIKRGLPLG